MRSRGLEFGFSLNSVEKTDTASHFQDTTPINFHLLYLNVTCKQALLLHGTGSKISQQGSTFHLAESDLLYLQSRVIQKTTFTVFEYDTITLQPNSLETNQLHITIEIRPEQRRSQEHQKLVTTKGNILLNGIRQIGREKFAQSIAQRQRANRF